MTVSNWSVVCPNTEGAKLWELIEVTQDSFGDFQSQSLGSDWLHDGLFLIIYQLHQDRATQLAQENDQAGKVRFYCNTVLCPSNGLEQNRQV